VEYALILVLIAIVVIVVLTTLGVRSAPCLGTSATSCSGEFEGVDGSLAILGPSRCIGVPGTPDSHDRRREARPVRDDDMRAGAERRMGADRRNGLSVLLAGCPACGRIAPAPMVMHSEGWLVVSHDAGIRFIACPDHRDRFTTK
jgi:hypothetical protein